MRVEALLCDAASVREGLLNILGAGVTRIRRPAFPAPLDIQLAVVFTLKPVEAKSKHQVQLIVQDIDGGVILQMDAEFGIDPSTKLSPSEPVAIPMVLNLRPVLIPRAATYSVELLVDSQLAKSMPFEVEQISGPPPLPGHSE